MTYHEPESHTPPPTDTEVRVMAIQFAIHMNAQDFEAERDGGNCLPLMRQIYLFMKGDDPVIDRGYCYKVSEEFPDGLLEAFDEASNVVHFDGGFSP